MNSMSIIERNIIEALQNFENPPFREAAIQFLNTLGYRSTRTSTETRDRRLRETLESEVEASGIISDRRAISDWQDFHILFQITDDEVNSQRKLFESSEIDLNLMDSYVFAVLKLSRETYPRTKLANITRFINKKIKQPIMVIFRYGDVSFPRHYQPPMEREGSLKAGVGTGYAYQRHPIGQSTRSTSSYPRRSLA